MNVSEEDFVSSSHTLRRSVTHWPSWTLPEWTTMNVTLAVF